MSSLSSLYATQTPCHMGVHSRSTAFALHEGEASFAFRLAYATGPCQGATKKPVSLEGAAQAFVSGRLVNRQVCDLRGILLVGGAGI